MEEKIPVTILMKPEDQFLLEDSVKFIRFYNGPLNVVLDLGAHVGIFSIWCALRGAKVYAYEPADVNIEFLKENIEQNKNIFRGEIIPVQLAVTEKTGDTLELRCVATGSGQQSLEFLPERFHVTQTVQTISLTDVLRDVFQKEGKIDYLKCDIEGAEFRFCGMDNETCELLGRVGFVEMSIHPLDNWDYFDGPKLDYRMTMREFLFSCGLSEDRFVVN